MSLVLIVACAALGAFGHRRLLGQFGAGRLQHLVRLPGNLLHELAHALAMLLTGYTVADFAVSLTDPSGRGHVRPGRAWLPVARPWITNLVSPIAPVGSGILALSVLHTWSGAPGLPTTLSAVLPVLRGLDPARWELWVGAALGFSVTAEMAPSGVDLAAWARPALVAGVLVAAAAWALDRFVPGAMEGGLVVVDTALHGAGARALAMAVWSGVVVAPIAWGIGRIVR